MGRASGLDQSPPAWEVFWEARACPKPNLQSPKARRAFSGLKLANFGADFGLNFGKIVVKKFWNFFLERESAQNPPILGFSWAKFVAYWKF